MNTKGLRRAGTIKQGDHEFIVYVDEHTFPKEGIPLIIVTPDSPLLGILEEPWTYHKKPYEVVKAWEDGWEVEWAQGPHNPWVRNASLGEPMHGFFDFAQRAYRIRPRRK